MYTLYSLPEKSSHLFGGSSWLWEVSASIPMATYVGHGLSSCTHTLGCMLRVLDHGCMALHRG